MATAIGVAGYSLVTRGDDEKCFSNTAIDGAVQPGGPASADQALASFLAVSAESFDIAHPDVADYRRSETNGGVSYATDDVTITAIRQNDGWWIGAIERPC